eukprot:scaffold61887_cov18-Tisochrysis_lutea.AAC.3
MSHFHARNCAHDSQELYGTAKQLSDTIIPHEYGLDPMGKLSIGSKIAKELVGKLLADLCAMRWAGDKRVCWFDLV